MSGTGIPVVAYFSMEFGAELSIPTYSGGLGVLAGDTIRSAADLEIPMVGVTILYRNGYFHQSLDESGWQTESPVHWPIIDFMVPLRPRITVHINGRDVHICAWEFQVKGFTGARIPVFFLDTNLPENHPDDRKLTDSLYGGDTYYRLCQEVVLGIGGVKMLRALGYKNVARFHLNEGHAALIVLALMEEEVTRRGEGGTATPHDLEGIRNQCIFTTHTPVPTGHDQFSLDLTSQVLGGKWMEMLRICGQDTGLNMTSLALACAGYINGVAMSHGQVSKDLFPDYPIHSITNGIHLPTWVYPSLCRLYDCHLPEWRKDALSLRYALKIPGDEIWTAHMEAKTTLMEYVNRETGMDLKPDVLTLAFARRATAYKRHTLLFRDFERLKEIVQKVGPIQVVFAGKAHPHDQQGKEMIQKVFQAREALKGSISVVYLANYDMGLAKLLVSGTDIWLNTPIPPLEASGTSGMKAAANGVPSLSILDGWWVEGHIEGVTGWSIGDLNNTDNMEPEKIGEYHANALYEKLADDVLPCYYGNRKQFVKIMRYSIALNGAFFNT